jgi:hypothetical protein
MTLPTLKFLLTLSKSTGSPHYWSPIDSKSQPLQQDEGDFFRDPNAARYPTYPIEPAIRALFTLNPKFDGNSIDFVACGSTMGNLLNFSRSMPAVFRFDVQLIANTIFLIRRQNPPTEVYENVAGYGHTFPEAYTQRNEGLKRSVCHQRVISYDFGGLRCLVRFGCDRYVKRPVEEENGLSPDSETLDHPILLQPANSDLASSQLQVINIGEKIPQDSIFDIKTRKNTNKIDLEKFLPRLWIAQIPGFVEAYYDKPGVFEDPHVRNVKAEVDEWENRNAIPLARLRASMERIRDIVTDAQYGCAQVSWDGLGPLKVTAADPEGGELRLALPSDLVRRW